MNSIVKVDPHLCTQCGLCVKVCRGTLKMGEHGPEIARDLCIACGHCTAVCPNDALEHNKAPLKNQVLIQTQPMPDIETAARFLRERKSIRLFQKKSVPHDVISQLLDIARFAPTACNSQGVSYYVVDDQDTLKKIAAAIADWAEEDLKHGALKNSPWVLNTINMITTYREQGEDTILRNAPCLIIALAEKDMLALGRDNTHFSITYAQLFASSLGLGTCWSGLFEYCAMAGYQPLLDLLNLPEGKGVTGAFMTGYPAVSYKRLVDRDRLEILWHQPGVNQES
jgi:Nitroreductase